MTLCKVSFIEALYPQAIRRRTKKCLCDNLRAYAIIVLSYKF